MAAPTSGAASEEAFPLAPEVGSAAQSDYQQQYTQEVQEVMSRAVTESVVPRTHVKVDYSKSARVPLGSRSSRFTGRRCDQARVQVRPSTSGSLSSFVRPSTSSSSIGSFVAGATGLHEDVLLSKLAALPQGTRERARLALARAHAGRVRPRGSTPQRHERSSPRLHSLKHGTIVPSVHVGSHDDQMLFPSEPSLTKKPIRPVAPPARVYHPRAAHTVLASGPSQLARVPRASTLHGKQRLLVGRRTHTAELLGLNSMRTLGAPMDPDSNFTLVAKVKTQARSMAPATSAALSLECLTHSAGTVLAACICSD